MYSIDLNVSTDHHDIHFQKKMRHTDYLFNQSCGYITKEELVIKQTKQLD